MKIRKCECVCVCVCVCARVCVSPTRREHRTQTSSHLKRSSLSNLRPASPASPARWLAIMAERGAGHHGGGELPHLGDDPEGASLLLEYWSQYIGKQVEVKMGVLPNYLDWRR